jgi:hypothetical protein
VSEQDSTEAVEAAERKPLLQVVNPDATPEEIAAIVAVFSALGGGDSASARKPAREWNAPHRQVRRSHPHGVGGWKSSALPR